MASKSRTLVIVQNSFDKSECLPPLGMALTAKICFDKSRLLTLYAGETINTWLTSTETFQDRRRADHENSYKKEKCTHSGRPEMRL